MASAWPVPPTLDAVMASHERRVGGHIMVRRRRDLNPSDYKSEGLASMASTYFYLSITYGCKLSIVSTRSIPVAPSVARCGRNWW